MSILDKVLAELKNVSEADEDFVFCLHLLLELHIVAIFPQLTALWYDSLHLLVASVVLRGLFPLMPVVFDCQERIVDMLELRYLPFELDQQRFSAAQK